MAIRRDPPPIGPDKPVVFPPVTRLSLANGLAVWCVERRPLPYVTVSLVVRAGSSIDPADLPGAASLTADMLDEGAGGRSAIEIQEAFGRLGTSLDTEAGADAAVLSFSVLPRHLAHACRLFADVVARPALAVADFERVRTLRLNRLRQVRNSPAMVADQALLLAIFGTHPYGHQPWGLSDAIERVRIDDVAAIHRAAYRPDACTLMITGAIDPGAVAELADTAFGDWRPADGPRPDSGPGATSPFETQPGSPAATPRVLLVDRPGAAQTELRIGHRTVSRDTPDYHALVLLNAILGGQFVSRINMNLREQKGYTYGAHTAFDLRRLAGAFVMQTSVRTDATGDAVREALSEIAAIGTSRPPTSDEMAFGHATLTRGYARNFETTGQIGRALAQLAVDHLPDDTFDRFVPGILAVGADALVDTATRHLHPDELIVVAVGDRAALEPALSAVGLGSATVTTVEI
jgi:predicted Zn-dependent peptidase